MAPKLKNSEDLVLLVDGETNEPLYPQGVCSRKQMLQQNLWHRASFVFIENHHQQFMVVQRSMGKEHYPGAYDLAAGGVMRHGETNEDNAQRELYEQLGIEKELSEIRLVGQHPYADSRCQVWGNVYYVKVDTEAEGILLKEEEVEDVRLMTRQEILDYVEDQKTNSIKRLMTPDSIHMFQYLLDNIGNVAPASKASVEPENGDLVISLNGAEEEPPKLGWHVVAPKPKEEDAASRTPSSCWLEHQKHGQVMFYGQSSKNCRITTNEFAPALDLSNYTGISMEIQSPENMAYTFAIQNRNELQEAKFEVPKSQIAWTRIELPFSEFQKCPELKFDEIHSMEIAIQKYDRKEDKTIFLNHSYKEGEFELRFKGLKAYGQVAQEAPAEVLEESGRGGPLKWAKRMLWGKQGRPVGKSAQELLMSWITFYFNWKIYFWGQRQRYLKSTLEWISDSLGPSNKDQKSQGSKGQKLRHLENPAPEIGPSHDEGQEYENKMLHQAAEPIPATSKNLQPISGQDALYDAGSPVDGKIPLLTQDYIQKAREDHLKEMKRQEISNLRKEMMFEPRYEKVVYVIEAESAGFDGGDIAEIRINGVKVDMEQNESHHFRGLHLVIIDPSNGKIEAAKTFDSYSSTHRIDAYIEHLIPQGFIVVAACKDDCVTKLSDKSKDWFQRMGSSEIWNLGYRQGFAFIGVNGQTEGRDQIATKRRDKVSVAQIFQVNVPWEVVELGKIHRYDEAKDEAANLFITINPIYVQRDTWLQKILKRRESRKKQEQRKAGTEPEAEEDDSEFV